MAVSFFEQGDPKPGNESPISVPGNASPGSGSGVKIAILFGAMLALVGATGYLYYQLGQLRTELSETREALGAKIAEIHETSNVSTQTSRRSVEALKTDVDRVRAQAAQLSGQAKIEATKHADELAARLEIAQQEAAQKVTAVTAEVSQVKESAAATTLATNTRIGEVSTEVGTVKSDVAATRSELEKTIADLKSTRGDLGVQSGLIATNSKELSALRALGERNYTEFKIARAKAAQRVGDVAVRLTKTDPKRNRYTIELVADDKTVEKKDRTINEPVQFLLAKATQPYELVVNDVKKDVISGYLAAPKVQQTRN
jgi:hypothetical protein